MGLLTTTVKINWNPSNKKHYINKGYKYTITGDEFEVKVEDLSNGCDIKIKAQCEECGEIVELKWNYYLKLIQYHNVYLCKKCRNKIKTKEKISFEQWCNNNLSKEKSKEILDKWDYELNKCNPNDIKYNTKIKYYFKCSRCLHPSELKQINNFTNGQVGDINCRRCNSFAQYLIDNYGETALNLYWDYDKNIINPWDFGKSTDKQTVWIKCQDKDYHKSYEMFPCTFTRGRRCPYCNPNGGEIHRLDSVGKILEDNKLLKIWSDKNIKSPYEYTPNSSTRKAWWKCINGKHEDYYRSISDSNRYQFHCPECTEERSESFLQEKVRLHLESLGNTILHEHSCTLKCINPKTNRTLPFDNEIKELKLIIEVHGRQHYKATAWYKNFAKHDDIIPEYELHMTQVRDRYKKFISYKRGYNYIAIPYWTDDKDETWKKLLDDKIKEITKVIQNN